MPLRRPEPPSFPNPFWPRLPVFRLPGEGLAVTLAPAQVMRVIASSSVGCITVKESRSFGSRANLHATNWARELASRLVLIYRANDETTPARGAMEMLEDTGVNVDVVRGDHHLPLYEAATCMRFIEAIV